MLKIYGFGNALIDIEVSITEQELTALNINKSSMVHINSEQKDSWLNKFKTKIISKEPGGSIANSLHAASSQGSTCFFSCSLGDDEERELFLKGFNGSSVETISKLSKDPTGTCFIFVTPDGERTMASHLSANENLITSCIDQDKLSESNWLLFDAFSVCTENGFNTAQYTLELAKKNNLKIAFGIADVNLIKTNFNEIKWVLDQSIDLVFGNKNEISLLKQLLETQADILCSNGSEGCTFNSIKVKAKSIPVVNTNGAGDALLGIFLSQLGLTDQKLALTKAVDYATQICLISGPRK
tara:strand:+ start:9939 stop:10832 length:894 start_codon:yes stop_codon:yes gene_type:complete